MTDEQFQSIIDHKVHEAVEPLERRWESLRTIIRGWYESTKNWSDEMTYLSVLSTMDELEKHDEPRRKLPTDPRRVKP